MTDRLVEKIRERMAALKRECEPFNTTRIHELEYVLGLIEELEDGRRFGRDDLGRCRMRGCNLCDVRKEQLQKKWTPVEVKLPETDGYFEVTIKPKKGKPHVEMCQFHKESKLTTWGLGQWEHGNVTAWRQRPEPYKGDEQHG